jgi:hypothetical protein
MFGDIGRSFSIIQVALHLGQTQEIQHRHSFRPLPHFTHLQTSSIMESMGVIH